MPTRTTPRTTKVPGGADYVRIPRQRRGRRSDPFVVVVPECPTLTRQALELAASLLWRHRRALTPLGAGIGLFVAAALLHALAWWSALVFAPAALAPLGWLWVIQRRRPAGTRAVYWRIALTALATAAGAWLALAAGYGPLSGPLELWWLLMVATAQIVWFFVRRSL